MNLVKKFLFLTLIFCFFIVGYIVNEYYKYEQKQEKVKTFQKLAFKGYSLVNAGKNKEAIKFYEEAVSIYDKEPSTLSDLAMLYRKNGHLKKAKEYYQKAYEVSNENYKHLYNMALCEYFLKNYQSSINTLNKLIHKDRNSSKYYKYLALNNYALGNKDKAFGYFRVLVDRKYHLKDKLLVDLKKQYYALETKPESMQVVFEYKKTNNIQKLENLMKEYERNHYDIKALRTAQKIVLKSPTNNAANKMAAQLYYKHGELGQAYHYALKIKIHDAKSLEILGAVYQNAKDFEKALESYEKSYAKRPKKDLLRAMSVCAFKAKKIKDMKIYIQRLTKKDPFLATKFVYAIETTSGIKHTFLDKLMYLSKLKFFEIYCKFIGCSDA